MKISYIFLGLIVILGWNAWAIQRDDQMWKKYEQTKAHKEYCAYHTTSPTCR